MNKKHNNDEFPEFPRAGYDIDVFEEGVVSEWVAVAIRNGDGKYVASSRDRVRHIAVERLRGSLGI